MKDSRVGESLWSEWTGEDYGQFDRSDVVFYTNDHVDLDNDLVKRSIASALQREGIAVSLGEGYRYSEVAHITYGYAGTVDGSFDLCTCDEFGETRDGDIVDQIVKITWVELECQKA